MKVRKIYCKHFPFKGYIALTLYPCIFIRENVKQKYTPTVNRHEQTHILQQIETLWIFFLLIYGLEYIIKIIITLSHNRAYKSISFEQEAYAHQGHVNYIKDRNHYEWIQYIFKLTKTK